MTAQDSLRDAQPSDVARLSQLVLDGVAHWGHDVNHPDAVAHLREHDLPTTEYVTTSPVRVLEDGNGTVIGFHGLRLESDFVDLVYMFVTPSLIGTGRGKVLWDDAIVIAARHAARMRILSDPCAVDFYAAMGATFERRHEASPGFFLSVMWFDLP